MALTKARQASKIREIGEALASVGYHTLDQQAKVLGLSRSTTWTLLKCSHKASGLSVRVVNQMLGAPQLPEPVRDKIVEYLEGRLAGLYGHSRPQCLKFAARLTLNAQSAAFNWIHPRGRSDYLDD